MKKLDYGVEGIPLGLFVDLWVTDYHAKSAVRTQKEARATIVRVIQYFPTLDDLTIRNRQRWLKSELEQLRQLRRH